MTPAQLRAYAQNCVHGHEWLKITTTEAPDAVCPYCATADVKASIAYTHTLSRPEDPSGR
jgi:hypothetical protein